jgi:ribosomal protein S3AE
MAKPIKKKYFEINLPLIGEKYEAQAHSIDELKDKIIKLDITRKLKGKSVDLVFKTELKNGTIEATPKKLTLMPFFITHMMHKGIDYIEDSFIAETRESQVSIKPFLITRKKVSRAVRRTLRNSAKNWIIDYLKTKTDNEVFEDILSNQLQKPLSIKLKKIYPLAICEIRIFELKKQLAEKKPEVSIKEEIKEIEKEAEEEIKEELEETAEKPKKKTKSKQEN